jgi:pilus assembly protein CpaE
MKGQEMILGLSVTSEIDRLRHWFSTWRPDEGGVSAIEFALIAPLLVFGLLGTVDIGLAVRERMNIDTVLRAGAHGAMSDRGEEFVLQIMRTTALENFTLTQEASTTGKGLLSPEAHRYCACPSDPEAAVTCSTTCAGPTSSPFVFYRLSAEKNYQGMILPAIEFNPSIQVQVR